MTHHDDTDPIEHDPTGMRALLGSLPDPGPMPADLVARIGAALAEEQRLREQSLGSADNAGVGASHAVGREPRRDEGGTVVPLRRRRGALRVLAAAAAVVGVVGLGGLVLETARPGGLATALRAESGSDSAAGSSADGGGGAAPSIAKGAADGVLESSPAQKVVVLAGGRPITSAELPAEAAREIPWSTASSLAPRREDLAGGTTAAVASAEGARACATGLGVAPESPVVVRLTVVDGTDAALVVAEAPSGARTAWAVARSCTASSPGVLAGPVPVP